jgi:hypothetical protein
LSRKRCFFILCTTTQRLQPPRRWCPLQLFNRQMLGVLHIFFYLQWLRKLLKFSPIADTIDFFAHVLYKWSLNYKELIMKNEIIVSFDKQNLNNIKMH